MDVAEELLDVDHTLDRVHIERRIEDWHRRILSLYTQLQGWLPPGWVSDQKSDVTMHEPLMRNFSVTEHRLPSLVLTRERVAVRLEPRGLWIIGANGRIDMVSFKEHDVLIDRAELYEPPRWTISDFRDQLNPKPLTRERFTESLP